MIRVTRELSIWNGSQWNRHALCSPRFQQSISEDREEEDDSERVEEWECWQGDDSGVVERPEDTIAKSYRNPPSPSHVIVENRWEPGNHGWQEADTDRDYGLDCQRFQELSLEGGGGGGHDKTGWVEFLHDLKLGRSTVIQEHTQNYSNLSEMVWKVPGYCKLSYLISTINIHRNGERRYYD